MTGRFLESASRVVAWAAVALAVGIIVGGVVVWRAGGGLDVGGVVGGVMIIAGVSLGFAAWPHTRR
jgi:hypothetical protein